MTVHTLTCINLYSRPPKKGGKYSPPTVSSLLRQNVSKHLQHVVLYYMLFILTTSI